MNERGRERGVDFTLNEAFFFVIQVFSWGSHFEINDKKKQ